MNAKIYRDGDRVIVSFEGIKDAEAFLQGVVNIVSEASSEPVGPIEVPNLEAPIDTEESFEALQEEVSDASAEEVQEEKEPEIEDFSEPFTGKNPSEIMSAPNFEGFYFLFNAMCNNSIPSCYREDSVNLIAEFIDSKKVLEPPYGNIERMKKYLNMAQAMLGKRQLPDVVLNKPTNVGEYNALCEATAHTIKTIRLSLNS